MSVQPSKAIRFLCLTLLFTALTIGAGCRETGFLITPVPQHRTLVETELSRDTLFSFDKIVLIDVSGVLMNSPRRTWLSEGEHPVSLLLEQLDKARKDRQVKGVILRLNSPGGTVVASELMYDEISHFRESGKPVVAVMMDVAASGAYYIACACDEIVAQPSTITGSIGVVMQLFDVSGAMNKVGIKSEAITSGTFKDTGSPWRSLRPEERTLFQHVIDDMYDRFVTIVAAGRPKLDEESVRRLADGRIYTASQALKAGLIDRVATFREAIKIAKERIGSEHVRLVTYHRPLAYRPNYYARQPGPTGGVINLINVNLPAWLSPGTPRFLYLWAPGRQ